MKTAQEVLESKLPKNRDVFPYCEVLEAMQDFATLHAQKIADKMVSERLREELIRFAMWTFSGGETAAITLVNNYTDNLTK